LNALIGHGLMVVGALLSALFAWAAFELGGQKMEREEAARSTVGFFRIAGILAIFLAIMFGRFV